MGLRSKDDNNVCKQLKGKLLLRISVKETFFTEEVGVCSRIFPTGTIHFRWIPPVIVFMTSY